MRLRGSSSSRHRRDLYDRRLAPGFWNGAPAGSSAARSSRPGAPPFLLPARAPGACGIAGTHTGSPLEPQSRRSASRPVGNDLCLGLERTAHEFRCPSPCGFHRNGQRSDLVKPQDGSPRSRFRRPLRRPLRAGSHGFVEESVPPQSLVLVLCALRVCAPNQEHVKNSGNTVLRRTKGDGGESSLTTLPQSSFATVATRRRGDNRSRCRGRRPTHVDYDPFDPIRQGIERAAPPSVCVRSSRTELPSRGRPHSEKTGEMAKT
jgi:hypothetical protein